MKHRNIDKQIRDRINKHESAYSDKLWSNIENQLDKHPKRVLTPFFTTKSVLLFASLALIVGFGLYLKYVNNQTDVSSEKPIIQTEENKLAMTEANNNSTTQTESNVAIIESANIEGLNSISHNVENASRNVSTKYAKQTHKQQSTTRTSSFNNKLNSKQNSAFTSIGTIEAEAKFQNLSTSISANSVDNNSLEKSFKQNMFLLASEKIMSVYSKNSPNSLLEFFVPDPKRKCPKFNTNVPNYFLEAFIAPDFNQFFYNTDNPEYTNYLAQRKASESPLLGYSLGLRAGMEFRNGLLFKTGISFSNIRYALDFQQKEVEILKYKVVPSDTIHGNGSVAYVFDTIAYIETGIRTVKHYNSLKTIELPLWIGYQINALRWSAAFNAGISVQLMSMQQGKVLSASSPIEPVEFTNSIEKNYNLYQRTWGVGLMASTQFSYKIYADYSLLFEPYVKYYPKSITQSAYPLRQKALIYGVNMGVKLSF